MSDANWGDFADWDYPSLSAFWEWSNAGAVLAAQTGLVVAQASRHAQTELKRGLVENGVDLSWGLNGKIKRSVDVPVKKIQAQLDGIRNTFLEIPAAIHKQFEREIMEAHLRSKGRHGTKMDLGR